jgi:hypothetical protein
VKLPKIDPVAIGWSVADQWRARGIGRKLTRRLFPKIMTRADARRAARGERPADEAAGEFFSTEEDRTMLQGSKSWIGLVGMLVGFLLNVFGIGDCTPDEIAAATCVAGETITAMVIEAADKLITAIFTVVAVIGIIHKQIREKRLKAEIAAAQAAQK